VRINMKIENKLYISFCIITFIFFTVISALEDDEQFFGELVSAKCEKTGKAETSIVVILEDDNIKRRFHFGLQKYLCKDGVKFFKVGLPVQIYYSSLDGWFPSIHKVVLNGKDLPLRSY